MPSNTITRQVELGTPGLNVVYPEPSATDISGVANLVSRTAQPGDFFPVGQTLVTYTYEDPSGNPASGTVTVNVVEGKSLAPFCIILLINKAPIDFFEIQTSCLYNPHKFLFFLNSK